MIYHYFVILGNLFTRRVIEMDVVSAIIALGAVFAVLSVAIVIAVYVVCSLGYMKALKRLGYKNAWLAWIPIVCNYALADAVAPGQENVNIIGTLSIPAMLFKLWWLVAFVLGCIPTVGTLLNIVVQVICLGYTFIKMFAIIDNTSEDQQKVIGYISGFFPIVAAIKFLVAK
jgi:hypothetical protein